MTGVVFVPHISVHKSM